MKLENQVCTLEQGKRIADLGVNETLCSFVWNSGNVDLITMLDDDGDGKIYYSAPAFTVAELGVMLPTGYDTMRVTEIDWQTEQWHGYDLDAKDFPDENGYKTEAQARAAMLIYLLENNIITAEEVNNRLQST